MNNPALARRASEQLDDKRRFISRRDRYFPMEPDGELAFSGFVQRPAAERAVRHDGRGLFDARDRVVVIEPSAERRIEYLSGRLESVLAQESELRTVIARYSQEGQSK